MMQMNFKAFRVVKDIKNTLITALVLSIKLAVVTIASIYIYNNVIVKHDITDIFLHYEKLWSLVPFLLLTVVVGLVGVNWGLEALKWRYILRKHETISFARAVEAVLSGITVSIAAPNRTLEFAGRIVHLEKLNKAQAAMLTIIGSLSQLLVTIITGITGVGILIVFYPELLPVSILPYFPVALAMALIFSVSFFLLNKLPFIFKIKYFKKLYPFFEILKDFKSQDLFKIIIMSFLRYLVFSVQFYLLLIVSGVNISFFMGIVLISVIYFIMTFIPTTIISELAVRGSVSVAVIGLASTETLAIINASFILWVINLMIPALLGSVFLFKAKIVKEPATA